MVKCLAFASKARNKINISSTTTVDDGQGGRTTTQDDLGDFWAIIKPISIREPFLNDQLQSRVTHKMTIRYKSAFANTAVTGAYTIRFGTRLFAVKGIINLDDDLETEGKVYQMFRVEENAAITDGA